MSQSTRVNTSSSKTNSSASNTAASDVAEPNRLLVVDDDAELRELTAEYLAQQGYNVLTAEDARAMDAILLESRVDLVVLDLMLPGEDGLSIAKRLKASSSMPIIMVSAQGEDIDRIVGLEIGADDYLAKPFNPRELLARVRAVLRRGAAQAETDEPEDTLFEFGLCKLDTRSHQFTRNGEVVPLTSGEFDLLSILVAHPNQVLNRDRILDLLTGAERSPFDRSIDVRVTRLRGKLEPDPAQPAFIKTVWGKGYMFCPDGD